MKHEIHHIGYAVNDIAAAAIIFEQIGYKKASDKTIDTKRNVEILFLKSDGFLVELIAPFGTESPVEKTLKKMGPTPYHICYQTESIEESTRHFTGIGFLQISNISSAPAIDGKKVVFLFHKEMGLIELVEQ